MKEAIVVKLSPTEEQQPLLQDLALACTKVWNIALYDSRQVWEATGKIPTYAEMCKQHKDHWWARQLQSHVAQAVWQKLTWSYKSWFQLRKKDGAVRPPGFRKKTQGSTITFKADGFRIQGHHLRLSLSRAFREKMASSRFLCLPFQSYRKIEGKLCLCEVLRRKSEWFAAIVVDLPEPPLKIEGQVMAIDLGAINTAACVDDKGQSVLYSGRGLLAIHYYFNKQIAKVQHRLTTRGRKTSQGLRALYQKRGRQISQNLHKISKQLVDSCVEKQITTIVVGDLRDIRKKMQSSKKTNLKTHAWAFEKFTTQLRYKAQRHGIRLVSISEKDTSKTCSHCGQVRKQNRVERGLYQCQACGCTMNADLNGATNLLNKYLQSQGFSGKVVLARLAVPVVRMVEKPKGADPISERPQTVILPAMVESPSL